MICEQIIAAEQQSNYADDILVCKWLQTQS